MPQRTRAQERIDEIDLSPTKLLKQIDQLKAELETVGGQAAEYLAGLQRERAEFQNYRRRTADERERDAGLASDGLLRKVLTLADDFDRAVDARPEALAGDPWAEGVAAIDRKLHLLLDSEGISPIEVAPGTPFDPHQHEALVSVPGTDQPEGSVVAELQRGYRIRDRVLRPAMVAVAAPPAGSSAPVGDADSAEGATADKADRTIN
jgi:molecular chaperone GrpE